MWQNRDKLKMERKTKNLHERKNDHRTHHSMCVSEIDSICSEQTETKYIKKKKKMHDIVLVNYYPEAYHVF